MSAFSDPIFWALVAGFALVFTGASPLVVAQPHVRTTERGCLLMIAGIVVIVAATAWKVLA